MGKIFRISDLPVSTIDSALNPLKIKKPEFFPIGLCKFTAPVDRFVAAKKTVIQKSFVKKKNVIGKLLPHFSSPKHKNTKGI